MKILKLEVSLTENGFKKSVIEYDFTETKSTYVRETYPRRLLKTELLKIIPNAFWNKLSNYIIKYETWCLSQDEDQAHLICKKAILQRIGELKDSMDKLLSGMSIVEPEERVQR